MAASPSAPSATVTIPITVIGSSGGTILLSPGTYFQVIIPYQSLAAAFDNVGITEDADPSPGNFGGYGNSFGAAIHWYPYPFIDVTRIGYGKAILNSFWFWVLLLFGLAAGATALDSRLGRRTPEPAPAAQPTAWD